MQSHAVEEEEFPAPVQAGPGGLLNSFAAEDMGPGGHHEAAWTSGEMASDSVLVCIKKIVAITLQQVGYFALEVSLLENYRPCAATLGLGQCSSSIKAGPSPHSLIHSSHFHLLENKVCLHRPDMSCYNQCLPCVPCQPCGPTPLANSCNESCVRQCQDSTVVIQPSPVVVTLPGPILSSFPQSTAVGSSTSAAVGSILSSEGVPISSGGFGLSGLGSRYCGRRCLPC
ncbi:uncharacterized protein LOC122152801 [Tyto alba]|uniref:uncharacterized protein LOC122152801 n=1 Tax=Tyto alba TaxID=56313 RepID=UPI001C6789EF|nr:uncharacterized protein LOC122152801 [Tyto alba]